MAFSCDITRQDFLLKGNFIFFSCFSDTVILLLMIAVMKTHCGRLRLILIAC